MDSDIDALLLKQARLSLDDRRELRNWHRFLRLWPKHKLRMLQRERWKRYLVLSEREAWLLAKARNSLVPSELLHG